HVGSNDLGNFSGFKEGQPQYEALVTTIHDATLRNKKWLGGPLAWMSRPDYSFLMAGSEQGLLRAGAQLLLKPPARAPGAAR
ncbi:MAG: hypothetical protein PHQ53_14015, partial [Candidatus Krumholzibacteria bacterium]|nr:hypothetical protein [Candidatus Krumholzibacteria bacterium]